VLTCSWRAILSIGFLKTRNSPSGERMLPSLRMTSLHLNYPFQKTCRNIYHRTLTCKWKTSRSDSRYRLNMCVAWFMSWIAFRRGRKQQPRTTCATALRSSMSYHLHDWVMDNCHEWIDSLALLSLWSLNLNLFFSLTELVRWQTANDNAI